VISACVHSLSCCHLASRWAVLERRSAWLVVDTQVRACSRETHSLSRASKICRHKAFKMTHVYAAVINSSRAIENDTGTDF